MSQENVETMRRMLAAWETGRFDEALTYFDPDIVWEQQVMPEGWVTHGTDEMQRVLRAWLGTWTEYSATFDEYIDSGERVIVVGTERGRAKSSGVEVNQPTVVVYTLRDGKIVHAKNYKNRAAALEAAGPTT
jgi:ketosteroid isomerase-like protein